MLRQIDRERAAELESMVINADAELDAGDLEVLDALDELDELDEFELGDLATLIAETED